MHSDNRIYGYRALNVRQIEKLAGEKLGRPAVYEFHYVNATRAFGIDERNTVIAIFHGKPDSVDHRSRIAAGERETATLLVRLARARATLFYFYFFFLCKPPM